MNFNRIGTPLVFAVIATLAIAMVAGSPDALLKIAVLVALFAGLGGSFALTEKLLRKHPAALARNVLVAGTICFLGFTASFGLGGHTVFAVLSPNQAIVASMLMVFSLSAFSGIAGGALIVSRAHKRQSLSAVR
jgi:hypothetical protein